MRQGCFHDVEGSEVVDFKLVSDEVQSLLGGCKLFDGSDKCCKVLSKL